MLSEKRLEQENQVFRGTRGVSSENRSLLFQPAFLDRTTGQVHPSRFSDGRLAPLHILDGLPQELVVARSASGRVVAASEFVVAGFIRAGRFYTREEAAMLA